MKYWKFNLSAIDNPTFGTFNKRLNGVLVGKKIVEIIRNDNGVGIRSVKTENGDYVYNDGGVVIVTNEREEVFKRSNHNSLITEGEFSSGCLVEYEKPTSPVKYLYGRKLDVLGEGEDYYFCRDQNKKEEFLVDKNSKDLRDYPDEGCLILDSPSFPYYKVEEYSNIVDGKFGSTSGKISENDPDVLRVYASDMFQALSDERKKRIKEFEEKYISIKRDILSNGLFNPKVQ